jgi:hypothetical protein
VPERVAAALHSRPSNQPGQAESLQQKDNLCGPFWAARVLRDFGIASWGGQPIDEDLIALRAGTVLPDSGAAGALPPGAMSRASYRYQLPTAPIAASGTAAGALAEAIESASSGALRCVPMRGRWTADSVAGLVQDARALDGARLIANVRTGCLWGSRPPLATLLDELEGRKVPDPAPDWDVGHFVELAGLIRGAGGALVHVHDSYPSMGWEGHHLQPPRVLASALLRGDGREGGVLVVVPAGRAADAASLAGDLDLDIGAWNNGTTTPLPASRARVREG